MTPSVTLTLTFSTRAEAAAALNAIDGIRPLQVISPAVISPAVISPAVISTLDNPATGAAPAMLPPPVLTPPAATPELDPRAVFGGSAAQAPLPLAAPLAPPALTPPSAGTAPTGALVLDNEGIPWDSRIHGETRTQNKDGTWRAKRGLTDLLAVAAIKSELLQLVAASKGAAAVPVVPTPPAATVAADQAASQTALVPPPPAGPVTFLQLFSLVNDAVKRGKLNDDLIIAVLTPHKLGGVTQAAQKPELIPVLFAEFSALVASA